MLSLETARQKILSRLPVPRAERVAINAAHGRILAESTSAALDLPPFDNSAMDGYAVRAADTVNASVDRPKALRLMGQSAAGAPFSGTVEAGGCLRVFTGAPMPAGADAVIMQEDTRLDPAAADQILILDGVKPWENVRFRGEDVRRGAGVLSAGDRLTAGRVGLAAALGCQELAVGARPRVALLATGSELAEPPQPLAGGQIYESNRTMLAPMMARAGALVQVLPLVQDTLAATQAAMMEAFRQNDIVVTSGGVSVGELDFVKQAFLELGGKMEFWRVAIKPGKPFVFGEVRGKYLFGLPGNPVSAIVTYLLLVRPALLRWQGAGAVEPMTREVIAGEAFENRGDRRHFVRSRLDESGQAHPAGPQASHLLSSLAAADGLVDLAPGAAVTAGERVRFLPFDE